MNALSLAFDTQRLAEKYEELSADRQFSHGKQLIEELRLRPGERVLDIGCGTGLLAEYVATIVGPTGWVTGIDPLPLRIEIAKRKSKPNLVYQVGNAYVLDEFAENSFDVVYLNAVFHWLAEKEEPLQHIRRVLVPGGRLGLTTGSKEHPNRLQRIRREVLSRPPYNAFPESRAGYPHWVSVPELVWLLDRNGFSIQKIEVQENVFNHSDSDTVIDFSQASSFGNFLGHLPPELRDSAIAEIKRALEEYRTPDGIRLEGRRILAVAVKK
ncbi:class I SAM-dependent methyltransferase [Candidatus Methylocalor cossyra]|uniref:Trans-aconitate 2-methyltransferase n=1 Tax=Candidatus Methylocalor cossyra TaxID=3108543 RepID=A0ABM9NIF0_9GAMM